MIEEEDEIIAGTQLLDRIWLELKKYVSKNLATKKKKYDLLNLKSENSLTVFNGDSTQKLSCRKNV